MSVDEVSCDNPRYAEDVFFDPWHWLAELESGEHVTEYDPDSGQHRNFADAVTRGVKKLAMLPAYPQRYPDCKPVVLLVPRGARPIFFRTRSVTAIFDVSASVTEPDPRITCIGFQQAVASRNRQTLLAFYDDGSALLTSERGDF